MTTYIQLNSADPSVLEHSTPGDFTVQLGRLLTFGEDFEVFLSEAVFPFTWLNVKGGVNNTLLIKSKGAKTGTTIELIPAFYSSIPVLVRTISDALKKASVTNVTISADTLTLRVTIDAGTSTVEGALLRLLGWRKDSVVSGKTTAPQMGDITGGSSGLYVMVDCVENATVGSFSVPLLKKVEVGRDDKPGGLIHFRSFDPVETHRLNQTELRHVSVTIKDAHNKVIDFEKFPVNLTLGIRERGRGGN